MASLYCLILSVDGKTDTSWSSEVVRWECRSYHSLNPPKTSYRDVVVPASQDQKILRMLSGHIDRVKAALKSAVSGCSKYLDDDGSCNGVFYRNIPAFIQSSSLPEETKKFIFDNRIDAFLKSFAGIVRCIDDYGTDNKNRTNIINKAIDGMVVKVEEITLGQNYSSVCASGHWE